MIYLKENAADILRREGISPSYPRKRILEYLIEHRSHPTVLNIYGNLIDEIPSLSKTTVYNTLNLFVEKGLVEEITIEGNEMRYDMHNHDDHAHFRCESCGRLYDIPMELPERLSSHLDEFQVTKRSIYFSGLCPDCIASQS